MRFSIAIPFYKIKYFKECLDSVLAQTYVDFEVLILNDKSPDDISFILNAYSDPRIRYLENEENVGAIRLVDNWNKLLSLAQGEYVINMGDDDKLMPNCLEVLSELIDRYPKVDIFHSRVMLIDEKNTPFALSFERPEFESCPEFILKRLHKFEQYIGDFCIRKSKLKEIGGYPNYPLAWCTDDVVSFEAAVPNGVVHSKEVLFLYRSSEQTISNSKWNLLKIEGVCAEHKWLLNFLEHYHAKTREEQLYLLQIRKELPVVLDRKKATYLAEFLAEKRMNIFKYLQVCKKYEISKYASFFALEVRLNLFVKSLIK